jgi:hypothetical protein
LGAHLTTALNQAKMHRIRSGANGQISTFDDAFPAGSAKSELSGNHAASAVEARREPTQL